MNSFLYSTFQTPMGDFTTVVDTEHRLVATAFGDVLAARARLGTVGAEATLVANRRALAEVETQITAYFAGSRRDFDLPLAPAGTAFQQRVWDELVRIPCGQTRSYGELAVTLGSSPRAVGRANATNPICVVIPCHRVIGADGSLVGFAFGEEIKRRLLTHEAALATERVGGAKSGVMAPAIHRLGVPA